MKRKYYYFLKINLPIIKLTYYLLNTYLPLNTMNRANQRRLGSMLLILVVLAKFLCVLFSGAFKNPVPLSLIYGVSNVYYSFACTGVDQCITSMK